MGWQTDGTWVGVRNFWSFLYRSSIFLLTATVGICVPRKILILDLGLRPFNPPRGVLGPYGPKVGNGVENEFPGPSGPGVQKVKNGVEKESKKLKKS